MFLLDPERVTLGEYVLDGVVAVLVDWLPQRTVEDWSDFGPWPVFADVPEQRLRITVVQRLVHTELNPPPPGYSAPLQVIVAQNASDRGRVLGAADVVVLEVRHAFGQGAGRGGERRIVLAGVSVDGVSGPMRFSPAPTDAGVVGGG